MSRCNSTDTKPHNVVDWMVFHYTLSKRDFFRLYWQIPFIWLFPGVIFVLPFFAPIEMWAHIAFVLVFHFQCGSTERWECSDIILSCGESKHPTISRPEMIPLRKHIIVLRMPKKNCFSFIFSHSHIFSFFIRSNVVCDENEMRWQHTLMR